MVDQILVLKEQAQFDSGNYEHMEWKDGRLFLQCDETETARGNYTSPEYKAAAFRRLVTSWNAGIPAGCTLEAFARVQAAGQWSPCVSFGKWSVFSARFSAGGTDRTAGRTGAFCFSFGRSHLPLPGTSG